MRTFYIFKINNMFQTFYNDKANILFKMFYDIYSSNDEDLINKFRLFEQITIPFNKRIFNKDDVKSPFEIKELIPNDAQLEIINHDYLRYGSGIFEAEPGCGKTLAAVGVIHKYKIKTLIMISSLSQVIFLKTIL